MKIASDRPIAVIAPSGAYDIKKLEVGLGIAREHGYTLALFPENRQPLRYLAASDEVRLGQLQQALIDPEFGAVWCIRGGYGITRLLPKLSPITYPKRPVIGFSDITALFAALQGKAGPLVHGPMLHSLPSTDAESIEHLFERLAGRPVQPLEGETWVFGDVTAPVIGGNLAMFAALAGTPWQADTAGRIVILEDIGEAPYRIDRLLQQLISSRFFDGVVGVGLGEFLSCDPPGHVEWTLKEIFLEHLLPLAIPVVSGLPLGHGVANRAFFWEESMRLCGSQLLFMDDLE